MRQLEGTVCEAACNESIEMYRRDEVSRVIHVAGIGGWRMVCEVVCDGYTVYVLVREIVTPFNFSDYIVWFVGYRWR